MYAYGNRLGDHGHKSDSHGLQPPLREIKLTLEENPRQSQSNILTRHSAHFKVLSNSNQNFFCKKAQNERKWDVECKIDYSSAIQVYSAKFQLPIAVRL